MTQSTSEYRSFYDFRYFNPYSRRGRQEIIDEMTKDGWELMSIEPAIPHRIAEHCTPPLLTFKRNKP